MSEFDRLHTALEREFRERERSYHRAKSEKIETLLIAELRSMNTIQSVLRAAGLPMFAEFGESEGDGE